MSEHPPASSPAKKRRLDDAPDDEVEPSASDKITRSEELWFEDGNIILQAQQTQFRVHRGHISIHSSTFKDMFLIPQPESENLIEGCPVIQVYVRAKDWENLLMAMYNNFKTNRMPKDYPIDRILSLLRLGYKYQFDYFRDIAADHLRAAIPANLDDWDKSSLQIDYNDNEAEEYDPKPFTYGFEIELLNTAMEVGLRSILPAVFFLCLRYCTLNDIFEGYTYEDDDDGFIWKLSPDIQRTILSAQSVLSRQAICNTVLKPLAEVDKARVTRQFHCESMMKCRLRTPKADKRTLLLATHAGSALQRIEDLCSCAACNDELHPFMQAGRRYLWENLPRWFKLPNWGEAKDFEE